MERTYDIKGGEWVDIGSCYGYRWRNTLTGEILSDRELLKRLPSRDEQRPVTDEQTIHVVEDEDDS